MTQDSGAGTGISDAMRSLVRESLPDLEAAGEAALIPLKNMSPHYISFKGDHAENGIMKLFSIELDGKPVYVYLKQE